LEQHTQIVCPECDAGIDFDLENCIRISRLALENGAFVKDCVELTECDGSFLHILSYYSELDYSFLEKVTKNLLRLRSDIEYDNENGLTPLLDAARSDSPSSGRYVQVLIEEGANVFAEDDANRGPLHLTLMGDYPIFQSNRSARSRFVT
jgi:hypothetical protein